MRALITGSLLIVVAAPALASADDAAIKKLYKAQCANCHGMDGKGKTTAGKAAGVKDWTDGKTLKAVTDDQMVHQIREGMKGDDGKEKMPPFKKLTDEQVKALIAYVRSNFGGAATPVP